MDVSRRIIRYTNAQLIKLNNGKVNDNSQIHHLFDNYPAPLSLNYANKHNVRVAKSAQKTTRSLGANLKRADIYSDEKIIEDIRKQVFSCITKVEGKVTMAITRMSGLNIPTSQITSIVNLFHHAMIECDFLIDEYLQVLFKFESIDENIVRDIYKEFINLVVKEFRTPRKFTDSHTESAEDKAVRWRLNNALILAKLYNLKFTTGPNFEYFRKVITTKTICERFLDTIFNGVDNADVNTIKLLSFVWSEIGKGGRLRLQAPEQHKRYIQKLENMANSSQFKMTNKVMLINLLEQ